MSDTLVIAADTICKVVPLDKTFCVIQPEESMFSSTISMGDILTVFGLVISLVTFCYQLRITRRENSNNLRSTWFLEVIVEPNLDMINLFFDGIIIKYDDKIKALAHEFRDGKSAIELHKDVAKSKREIKDEIKNSLDNFRTLLKASEPEVARKIDGTLDKLIDVLTVEIDSYESNNDSCSVKAEVLCIKQEFVSVLYKSWNRC